MFDMFHFERAKTSLFALVPFLARFEVALCLPFRKLAFEWALCWSRLRGFWGGRVTFFMDTLEVICPLVGNSLSLPR